MYAIKTVKPNFQKFSLFKLKKKWKLELKKRIILMRLSFINFDFGQISIRHDITSAPF